MKTKILTVLLMLLSLTAFAQNDLKARIEYEEAETAFATEDYSKAITHLTEAEKLLGKWTSKIGYLKIQVLNKIVKLEKNDYKWNDDIAELYTLTKKYMTFVNNNPNAIDLDKVRKIYEIEKNMDYAKNVKSWREMPEFIKAIEAENNKNFSEAIEWHKKASKKDNAIAELFIGRYYYGNNNKNIDFDEAMRWYLKAAKKDNRSAMEAIGDMYFLGKGVSQNYDEAKKWYEKAAEKGRYSSAIQIAEMYFYTNVAKEYPKDVNMAIEWINKAIELSYSDYQIAKCFYLLGRISTSKKNNNEAINWYKKAAVKGDVISMQEIADSYYKGTLIPKDNKEALKWYEQAANKYDNKSALQAAKMYYYSDEATDIIKDYDKAAIFAEKALKTASSNEEKAESSYVYGRILFTQKKYTDALKLFEQSHSNGNKYAKNKIAEIYEGGLGVEKNKKLAKEWRNK